MVQAPLLPLLLGIVAGVLCQRFVPQAFMPVVFAIAAIAAMCFKRRAAAIVCASAIVGWATGQIAEPIKFDSMPSSKGIYRAMVLSVDESDGVRSIVVDGERSEFGVGQGIGHNCRVVFTDFSAVPIVAPGDIITFSGKFSPPGINVDLPGDNDLSSYYYNNGISLRCFVADDSLRVVGRSGNVICAFRRLGDRLNDRIARSGVSERTAQLLCAMIGADSKGVDPDVRESFAVAGIAHLLALSGTHLAIIAILVLILLLPLSVAGYRKARWGATIVAVWAYVLLTGMPVSVVRSAIMLTCVLFAMMVGRPRSSLNFLCLAAILILLFSPHALYTAAFQLSFAATLAIVMFVPQLSPFAAGHRSLYRIWGIVAISVSAVLGTLPLSAWWFHMIPIWFLPANILAALLVPVLIGGGLLQALIGGGGVVASILDACTDALFYVSDFIASLPVSRIDRLYFSPLTLIPAYGTLVCLWLALSRKRAWWLAAASALLMSTLVVGTLTRPHVPQNEMFILRDTDDLRIVVNRGGHIYLLSAAPPSDFPADSLQFISAHPDFLALRLRDDGITLRRIAIPGKSVPAFGTHYNSIPSSFSFGTSTFTLAGTDVHSSARASESFTYCIVTRHFSGDIVELAKTVRADTIMLTADIPTRRRRRYLAELTSDSIPHIDLSAYPFSLTVKE